MTSQGQVPDEYAVAAEYYDLWATSYWRDVAPELRAALAGIEAADGPILELGAGSGLGTLIIADAVPQARIIAVEPSRAMRGILVSKIVGRPDLHDRVTILPVDLAGLTWPRRLGGFVAMAMLGHLTPEERMQLWRILSDTLAPDATAVLHLQPPERPERVPPTRHTAGRLGELDYEGWSEAEPDGDRTLRWMLTYRVLRSGDVLDEQRWTSIFQTVSERDVVAEAETVGLRAMSGAGGLVTLRSASRGRRFDVGRR